MYYPSATKEVLLQEKETLSARYRELCDRHYDLNMSRGKPGTDQLNLSEEMLTGPAASPAPISSTSRRRC